MTPLLSARAVSRRFGAHVALRRTELEVREGEVLALVGPNGAGKSTLLALLAGALEPSEGRVEARPGITVGWMPQRPAHYARLSARQNLELFARLERAEDARANAKRLLAEFELPTDERPAAALSVGNRQRLDLAIAVLARPSVLLLDEPTAALDVGRQQQALELVDSLRRDAGLTVLSAMHDLTLAGLYADRLVLLDGGRVVASGTAREVLTPELIAAHYGAEVSVVENGSVAVIPSRRRRE